MPGASWRTLSGLGNVPSAGHALLGEGKPLSLPTAGGADADDTFPVDEPIDGGGMAESDDEAQPCNAPITVAIASAAIRFLYKIFMTDFLPFAVPITIRRAPAFRNIR
jgi:hypothetical protein